MSPNPILDTTKPHGHRLLAFRAMRDPQNLPEDYVPGFQERGDAIERDLVHYLTKVDETMTSRTLTREGQVNTLVTLAGNQSRKFRKRTRSCARS
jgi:hypothetical protein